MLGIIGKFLDSNEKQVTKLGPVVEAVNDQEKKFEKLTDAKLKEKTAEFKLVLLSALKITFLASVPIAIGGIIFGKEIINFLFGTDYLSAVPAFQILMLTILIIFPAAIVTNASLAADQQKNFIAFAALGAFGNIILDLFLIPKFGIAGCAAATVITQILANTFMWFKLKIHISD